MFGRFRRESPPLQLYGKLPLARDYLRVGASRDAGRAFREWLDLTFSSPATGAEPPRLAGAIRFLLSMEGLEPLQGCLWPSSDAGGERVFPFAMFVDRRRRAVRDGLGRSLDDLVPTWTELERRYAMRERHRDGAGFLDAMRGLEVPIEALGQERSGARVDWRAWVAALWADGGEAALRAMLEQLVAAAASAPGSPYRLPIVPTFPSLPQAYCWWTALTTLRVLPADEPPTLLLSTAADTQHPSAPFCLFLPRQPAPEHGAWLAPVTAVPLGPGDQCRPEHQEPTVHAHEPEGGPSLADTMRGVAATVRARLG